MEPNKEVQTTETKIETPLSETKAETPAVETKTTDAPKVETKPEEVKVETKTDETKKEETKEEKKEEVTLELSLPEGSLLDESMVENIRAEAKEKGWTKEQAQEAITKQNDVLTKFVTKQQEKVKALNEKEWVKTIKEDPDFGGANIYEAGELAAAASDKWFGPEFTQALKDANLNHNPALFKGLVKLAKAGLDDKIVHGGGTPVKQKSAEELFYPADSSKGGA